MNWLPNRLGGFAFAMTWLVLVALAACERPNIPVKQPPRAPDMSAKPETSRTQDEDRRDDADDPDGDDDEADDVVDDPDPSDAPDAGVAATGEPAGDDADPDGNAGGPIAGASGAGSGGAGGAGGADAEDTAEPGEALVGFWSGHVVDVLGPMFDLCMQITQVGTVGVAGTTSYSNGATCGGELSYLEMMRDTYSFGERIVWGGPCIPAGRIDMRLNSDGTLDWEWFRTGSDVPQETSTMERVDRCPE
jgi:hypothetical protein